MRRANRRRINPSPKRRDDADREIRRRELPQNRLPYFSAPRFHPAGSAQLDKNSPPFALDRALSKCGHAASPSEKFRTEGSLTLARDLRAFGQKLLCKQLVQWRTKNARFPSA